MGLPCSKISTWRRFKSSDAYKDECDWQVFRSMQVDPGTFMRLQLGRFRHDIYNYGLGYVPYDDNDTKSIYLYLDGIRIIKASMTTSRVLDIEFRNDDIMNRFGNAVEDGDFKRREEFEDKFFYVNFYADDSYFSWPFIRYVKKQRKQRTNTISI